MKTDEAMDLLTAAGNDLGPMLRRKASDGAFPVMLQGPYRARHPLTQLQYHTDVTIGDRHHITSVFAIDSGEMNNGHDVAEILSRRAVDAGADLQELLAGTIDRAKSAEALMVMPWYKRVWMAWRRRWPEPSLT